MRNTEIFTRSLFSRGVVLSCHKKYWQQQVIPGKGSGQTCESASRQHKLFQRWLTKLCSWRILNVCTDNAGSFSCYFPPSPKLSRLPGKGLEPLDSDRSTTLPKAITCLTMLCYRWRVQLDLHITHRRTLETSKHVIDVILHYVTLHLDKQIRLHLDNLIVCLLIWDIYV